MPTLYLLRHAKSDWGAGVDDHARSLNGRGRRAAVRMGEHLASLGARPERVLVSSARRTLETWEGLASAWPLEVEVVISDRLYLASAGEMLAMLGEQPGTPEAVLVIAHNPGTQDLAVGLAGEGDRDDYDRMRAKYPTAGLCELAFDGAWADLAAGRARLVRFDVPKRLPG